ncbi:hypothetical protein [Rhodococcus daqingensis]|uniref:RES domain-containing protein n=1 Tax=Rhodococcus daqingensis TaxID=2479363 RepID=A0ABW2RZF4_9NOCA
MKDNPRTLAERPPAIPSGDDLERFAGYGVMGAPFASGHCLALRHFPASSIGEGYDAVWHRDPAGRWAIFSSNKPENSCSRYFGSALEEARSAHISVTWTGSHTLTVAVDEKIVWDLELRTSPATAAMTRIAGLMPAAWWNSDTVLKLMSRFAGRALGVGRIRLTGRASNGHRFRATPRMLWTVQGSRATIDGVDIGPPGPLAEQARLGDFWLPQRAIFAIGETYFDPSPAD